MDDIKTAISNLEKSVLRLESVLHQSKKDKEQAVSKVEELKGVIRNAYNRLDRVLTSVRQGQGGE